MERVFDILSLAISLLYLSQTEGYCSGAVVSISGEDRMLLHGEGFNLSCGFTCLTKHVAQLCRNNKHEVSCLVNITSALPNVTLVMSISSATEADTGVYFCRTQPPIAISPNILIEVGGNELMNVSSPDNLTASTLTTPSTLQCDSTQHSSGPAQCKLLSGLQGQIWYWILLGKAAVFLLSLASLAVKCKQG